MGLVVDIKSKLSSFDMSISFSTNANRIGILGASGAGKSMLLKYLSGIISPDEGIIKLNENTIFDSSKKINVIPQKRNVAYMFQNYALFPNMSVRKNIEIIINGSKEYKRKKASELMKKFCIDNLSDTMPNALSGGQQQRVALARIMAYEPQLILLDEPFSAMDSSLKERLQLELEEIISDYGGMVIMVSHSKDEIYRFSEEIVIIDNGNLVEKGVTKKIFGNPKTIQGAKMVGVSNILPAYFHNKSVLKIPDFNMEILGIKLEELTEDSIKYIGIKDTDFRILDKDDENKNFIEVNVEKIYEGIENIKIYFSIKEECKKIDAEKKIYVLRLNKKEYRKNILEKSVLKISVDKEKIIFMK